MFIRANAVPVPRNRPRIRSRFASVSLARGVSTALSDAISRASFDSQTGNAFEIGFVARSRRFSDPSCPEAGVLFFLVVGQFGMVILWVARPDESAKGVILLPAPVTPVEDSGRATQTDPLPFFWQKSAELVAWLQTWVRDKGTKNAYVSVSSASRSGSFGQAERGKGRSCGVLHQKRECPQKTWSGCLDRLRLPVWVTRGGDIEDRPEDRLQIYFDAKDYVTAACFVRRIDTPKAVWYEPTWWFVKPAWIPTGYQPG